MTDRRALVVGGGIAGLSAAVTLIDAGWSVDLWEAGPRVGGKIATSPFGGLDRVDEGADAYLRRVPDAVAFAERVGVSELTAPTGASASVWHDRLHDIPGGIVLGVPASVIPFATTSLLSWRGKLRAAAEPFLPRRDPGDNLGALVRHRFGGEVHERLVDSLVGSIYATDTDRSSLAAVPQLEQLAAGHRSLLIGGRKARARAAAAPDSPVFSAPATGMATLTDTAADALRAAGGTIHLERPATSLVEADGAWLADGERFDAVVLATPADAAGSLLNDVAPESAAGLSSIETADVIMVRLTVPATAWPDRLLGRSGYLVPKPDQRFVTAASFGSQKWAHWQPADGSQILRVSLGRDGLPVRELDDEAVVGHTVDEVGHHLDIDLQPGEISITRWIDAFPQYRPYHHDRVQTIEAGLPDGLALAGASYRGIGIPACVASGVRAAGRLTAAA